MKLGQGLLQIYEAGKLTVLGFGGKSIHDQINIAELRDEIVQLIRDHKCEVLAFDLTGVRIMPSGMLGLFASLRKLNVEVHIYNPSDDVREVLEFTKLNRLLHVHELEI